jgi:hypothetical protein
VSRNIRPYKIDEKPFNFKWEFTTLGTFLAQTKNIRYIPFRKRSKNHKTLYWARTTKIVE